VQETIGVEEQVEAELVAAGGVGQRRECGVQGLWRHIEDGIRAERERYRFR
jgi:hypothetical protein